ncbi:MAG: hypothetical protein IPP66_10325 [Anaerolineales bacterium]|nr:hypothetical protein [Anaerolineales bacterium]
MKSNFKIVMAIAGLALAALACQAVTGAPGDTNTNDVVPVGTDAPDVEPAQTEEPVSNADALLEDDFSMGSDNWGTGTDASSAVEYVDDALNFQVFEKNYIVWSYPNEEEYKDIHMEVTVINNGTDSTTAFGFFCDKQYPIDDSRYYFAVTPLGQYAIAKAALAQTDLFLTNDDQWGHSDLIAQDADSYRLGADCGNGKLTLYVDGQEVDSVEDSTYTSGSISLFVWSGEEATTTNVSFDDFVLTQLP